jgi:hypothetical protein
MLRVTYARLQTVRDQAIANALIESFSMHARILMDFYASKARGDDAVAAHFTRSGTFEPAGTGGVAAELRTRVNKQIVHLTYSRTGADKIGPADRAVLLAAVEADHRAFVVALAPEFASCFAEIPPPPPTHVYRIT